MVGDGCASLGETAAGVAWASLDSRGIDEVPMVRDPSALLGGIAAGAVASLESRGIDEVPMVRDSRPLPGAIASPRWFVGESRVDAWRGGRR